MKKIYLFSFGSVTALLLVFLLVRSPAANDGFGSEIRYLTAEVTRGSLVATVTATGRVRAMLEVKVGTQLSGQIAELFVDFNDEVQVGQPLAQLDSRSYEAKKREATANLEIARAKVLYQNAAIKVAGEQITSAEAQYAEAKRIYDRRRALRKKGTMSEAAVDEADAQFQSAAAALRGERAQLLIRRAELKDAEARVAREEALLSQAEIELSRTLITAPIGGTIVGRGVEKGQTVAASLRAPTLFEIAQDLSQMEVHVSVDEADIGQVQIGQEVSFTVDAYPARDFTGSVIQIRKSPAVRNNVVTYTVVVSAQNPELLLLPGMTATVQMVVLEVSDAIRIPNAALRFRPPGNATTKTRVETATSESSAETNGRLAIVWVTGLLGGPSPVEVRVGASDGTATELLSGSLDVRDKVVVGMTRSANKPTLFGIRLGS